jgi:hypothetical protein
MTYSETLGIICAALAGIAVLIIIVWQVRQSILRRRGSPDLTASEASDASGAPEASQQAVLPAVSAAVQVPQPVQAPQVLAAEAVANPEPNPDEAAIRQPITSQEIVSHLKELPPVQAEIEKGNYQGVKVEWTLYFSSLMLKGQSQVEVSLLNADNAFPAVSFIADINQYPELRTIKWGMPVVVQGEISSVYSMYIVLTDVQLSFPDSAGPDN